MDAKNSTLRTLIEGSKVFSVPLYQRRYSWGRENWRALWQDILEQYDLAASETPSDPPVKHFIGSFVLAPSAGDEEYTKLIVVDGQQRLTTVMILLAAIRDYLAEQAQDAKARDKSELKYNTLYLQNAFAESDEDRLKLVPTQQDRAEYGACVGETPADPVGRMGDAYNFFVSIAALRGKDLRGNPIDAAKISEIVLTRLTLVEIWTQVGDNVHQIFQTLNSAGVKLKQVDLLRNHFFMLLPTRGERLYPDVWREMELRLGEAALDRFFWADLVRRDARVTRGDVYSAMQRRLDPIARKEADVEDALRAFSANSRDYQAIVAGVHASQAISQRLQFLKAWGADTAQPVMLELLVRLGCDELTESEVVEGLKVIESFLVRRMLCGIPTNNLNRTFTSMASVMAAPAFGSAELASYLAGDRKYWPSDAQMLDSLLGRSFELNGRMFQRVMVLESLLSPAPDFRELGLEIVHIAPLEMSPESLVNFGDEGDGADALHAQLVDTIGNLTLAPRGLAESLPHEIGARLIALAALPWNSSLSGVHRWAGDDIRERAAHLASLATETWRAPEGVQSDYDQLAAAELESLVRAIPYGSQVALTDLIEVLGRSETFVRSGLREMNLRLAERVLDNSYDGSSDSGVLTKEEVLNLARDERS